MDVARVCSARDANMTPRRTWAAPGLQHWRGGSDPAGRRRRQALRGKKGGRSPLACDPLCTPTSARAFRGGGVSTGAHTEGRGHRRGQRTGQRRGHRPADALAPSCDPRQRPELAVVEREGLGDQTSDALGDGPRGAPLSEGQHVVSAGLPLAVQRLECRGAELVTERPKSIDVSNRERRQVAPLDRPSRARSTSGGRRPRWVTLRRGSCR